MSERDGGALVLPFEAVRKGDLPRVGGKGANLGEMAGAGFPVPPGFCVTTAAWARFLDAVGDGGGIWEALDGLPPDDAQATAPVGARIRARLEEEPIPGALKEAILSAWRAAGAEHPYAVRSSATAEDLPDASFAGQQDTYLNVRGEAALLDAVRACWASLFTDRAILYRTKNHFAHKEVQISVVVQRMVLPDVSGIMFTADPVSGDRKRVVIEASYGLGEALVSGRVSPDRYVVSARDVTQVEVEIGDKRLAIRPRPEGGTFDEALGDDDAAARVLTDAEARALAELGLKVQAHYGDPQDTEWAMAGGQLFLLQARPITSLYPLPTPAPTLPHTHVYFCFNHAQVMTEAMTALGCDLWRLILPFGKGDRLGERNPYMVEAGGRVYLDLTPMLLHPLLGRVVPKALSIADPLASGILARLRERPDVQDGEDRPGAVATVSGVLRWLGPAFFGAIAKALWEPFEGTVPHVEAFIAREEAALRAAADAAPAGVERLRHLIFKATTDVMPRMFLFLPAYVAAGVLSGKVLPKVVGEGADPADLAALTRAFDGNVTTEMDLAVGDLADVARPHPELVAALRRGGARPSDLKALPGGPAFTAALDAFLERYGMRGPGEIDIGRPRWADDPTSVLQFVAGNLAHGEVGDHRRHHAALKAQAGEALERLAQAASRGPLGGLRARLVRRLGRVHRAMMAIREHPKFLLVRMLGLVRAEALALGEAMVERGQIPHKEAVFSLDADELLEAAADPHRPVAALVAAREASLDRYRRLDPPKVMTSDGEQPRGGYGARDLPEGALPGVAASAGVVEGIARVVLDPTQTVLHKGEILIAPFTDPGWTPLFINAAGLVMEVGGMMTHGSVVAREYGIPAVVSVPGCTRLLRTGQRVRVHGDGGYVEILAEEGAAAQGGAS